MLHLSNIVWAKINHVVARWTNALVTEAGLWTGLFHWEETFGG